MLALVVLACGFFGFLSGVGVTERDLAGANPFALLYYAMGLFILGGMDLGVPVGGPWWGQALSWAAYFGAPLLTTSALVEWLQVLVANPMRWLRKMKGHTIIVGVNDLSRSVMDKIDALDETSQMVVVDREIRSPIRLELADRYHARCITGEFTDEYFLKRLRIQHVNRVLLASDSDFDNFETASKLLELRPELAGKIVLHCNRLRYLRAMEHSNVVQRTHTFNSYHLAAKQLVHTVMLDHFRSTEQLDNVILAGFGRFGQTVLEELQRIGKAEIESISIIDVDANRRVLVAEEQVEMDTEIVTHVFQGDIGHPEVWQKLEAQVDLDLGIPLVLMATGQDDENLRAGIWLRKRHPKAKVLIRSQRESHFAESVSQSSGITTFSLQEVFKEALPDAWFAPPDQSA
ncbi:MAG: Trk K+ transport system NAD-binding subunit [Candidatus Azotimanducaceae bacterium]|jgi:Trk K+ transport system NAD-binding subunit